VSSPATSYEVQGRTVSLPLTIDRATSGVGVFTADAGRIAERLPPTLSPVRLPTGRALVVLMLVDYLDNPLGDYDEGVVGFAARPAGDGSRVSGVKALLRGRVGMWVEHMPVSQAFTREAGETDWGYPKTLDTLAITRRGRRASLTWDRDGSRILRLDVKTGGRRSAPAVRGATYTRKDGVVHRTPLVTRASGVRAGLGGARVELGPHPTGRALAELDLSERAIASAWIERASMTFDAAVPMRR